MPEFVINPRRAPRAVVGCDARVALRNGAFFRGPAVDCGPAGCQLVLPAPLAPHERLYVELTSPGVGEPSLLVGRVAWSEDAPPFRSGVQFDAACREEAATFFGRIAAAHPELVDGASLPERVSVEAWIVPWRREEDAAVLPAEEEVLLEVGAGIRVGDLRERLGARWEQALNPLFALVSRRLLVIEEPPAEDG